MANNKILINYQLETSTHDGYCSGGDCEYECKTLNQTAIISEQDLNEDGSLKNFGYYGKFIEKPYVFGGSYYCKLSDECYNNNLDKHEYRLIIKRVVLDPQESDYEDE